MACRDRRHVNWGGPLAPESRDSEETVGISQSRSPIERGRESDGVIVCAGQRASQEGSSPSGARVRSAISKSGGNASLARQWIGGRAGCRS
jgi:hypothetical protein